MSEIQRYDFKIGTEWETFFLHGTLSDDGYYVLYTDHLTALAEKEADWQLKYDLLTDDYEQKWGLSNRLQEQIAVLEMAVKEKDERIESLGATAEMVMDDVRTLQEQIAILKEKREIWEERNVSLETKITDLTDEFGTVKEILRQLNNRDKRLQDEALQGEEEK